jgi:hypothetical protein
VSLVSQFCAEKNDGRRSACHNSSIVVCNTILQSLTNFSKVQRLLALQNFRLSVVDLTATVMYSTYYELEKVKGKLCVYIRTIMKNVKIVCYHCLVIIHALHVMVDRHVAKFQRVVPHTWMM